MVELIKLYFIFFKLGIMNFGGGYALLPLLDREFAQKRDWVTSEDLADYYAIGQCTPGAFAVNISTFIGIKRKGVLGGIVATLGFISPAFVIIFIIASLLTNFASNTYVMNALAGIRVCVFFLVLYAISKLAKKSIKDVYAGILAGVIAILAISVKVIPLYVYIIFAALFGLLVSYIREKKINNEPKEKEEKIKEKMDYKPLLKDIGISLLGFIVGLVLGLIGLISFIFAKNKKYRNGVLSSIILWIILVIGFFVYGFLNSWVIFKVYFQFFKIGICAFGGGLATIPFLSELGQSTGWFSQLDLANMIAVSESTPGAMGINMSTYVGYTVLNGEFNNLGLSFIGSIISTLGLVTPSIIVIVIVNLFLSQFKNNKYVEWAFYGLRAASIGLVLAALYSILKVSLFEQYLDINNESVNALFYAWNTSIKLDGNLFSKVTSFFDLLINFKALAIGLLFGIGIFKFKKHPIIYITLSAVVGILLQMNQITII